MVARLLLDKMQCGGPHSVNIDVSKRKRTRPPPPAWSGIPLKRRKLRQGQALWSENSSLGQHSISQEGLASKCAGRAMQQALKGQAPPSAWPYMYGHQGSNLFCTPSREGMGNKQQIIDQIARQMVDSVAGLGHVPSGKGPGFLGWYGKKWQPRGWVPTINGVRDPRRPIVDATKWAFVEEHEKIHRSGSVDLCVTGTNGCIEHESPQELVKPILEKAAARIIDTDVLAQFGLDYKTSETSKESSVECKNMELPWFDLSTLEADFLAGSEQVPSSASEFSLDFDSLSGTLPIIEYTSARQDSDKSGKPSEKSKETEASAEEISHPAHVVVGQKSVNHDKCRG